MPSAASLDSDTASREAGPSANRNAKDDPCRAATGEGRHFLPERKINLLIVVAALGIGGAEVVIEHLARSLDHRRFNVTICCIKVAGPIGEALRRDGYDVVVLTPPDRTNVDYFTFLRMRRLIRDRRIDIVHSHSTEGLADAAVCRLFSPRLRLVHTFHYGNYPHLEPRHLLFERVFARFATRKVAVSEVQRRQLMTTYHFSESTIERVWNGVPRCTATPDGSFRAKIGVRDEVLIGTVATLTRQKGLNDLLTVARRLHDSGRQARFVVIGDGHLRTELAQRRCELGLENTVVFTGWVKDASLRAVPEFDVFFQPSLWEAMSMAVLEAMAAGVPVVATRVGENPYIITDGIDGLLAEPRDTAGMAAALSRLVDEPTLRCELGAAARATVAGRFTVEQMTEAYERIYLELA